jgi:hypothetical protein
MESEILRFYTKYSSLQEFYSSIKACQNKSNEHISLYYNKTALERKNIELNEISFKYLYCVSKNILDKPMESSLYKCIQKNKSNADTFNLLTKCKEEIKETKERIDQILDEISKIEKVC